MFFFFRSSKQQTSKTLLGCTIGKMLLLCHLKYQRSEHICTKRRKTLYLMKTILCTDDFDVVFHCIQNNVEQPSTSSE